MDYIQLSRISLKHLSVLHVLLATSSVTKTSEQLCVSPSSISKTLSQLRLLLNDELFYRDGTHLVPTAYAIKIGPIVHSVLSSMNGVIHQQTFEPASYSGTFKLSMRSSAFEVFAPIIAQLASEKAPNSRFQVYSKEQLGLDALIRGQVDLVLLPHDISQPPTDNSDLQWQTILDDEMVCLMNSEHPLANSELTIEQYLEFRHIGIVEKELSVPFFEQNLAQRFKPRNIAISVSDFGSGALMCHETDFLFTTSRIWAETARQARGLTMKRLPFDYGKVAFSMVWNKASINDPSMKWLYNELVKESENLVIR
ncbi:LysR family transcriptional regulator [Vibrio hannami]|uniref:LysR family transcriptional regulator n=1 Tax=Vibrio hannami TaxID=2717094 RepID=UPI00241034FB|nr:LysR family transcriptional regulator [Vibrio hannami]MDG3085820.1 LysR family transcriptional regulator [Vibrio hannami]